MTNFKDKIELTKLLVSLGFTPFGPGHSASNGYDIKVNDNGRRACFYDNRIWGDEKIEFSVMDYGEYQIFKKLLFGLYTKKVERHRYGIFSIHLDESLITKETVTVLLRVAKEIP